MKSLRVAAMLTAWLLAGVGVRAAVILPADLAMLVTGARAIVHGRVVAVEPRWLEGRRGIESLVTLRVEEYLKGNLGDEVTFKVPGGQMGPYRSFIVGAPTFSDGDEVVVFLNAQGPTIPWISGLNQGVFRVAENDSGVKMVLPGISLAPGGEWRQAARGDPARRRMAYSVFADQVRTILRERTPRGADLRDDNRRIVAGDRRLR
jgi:hypothetical protein